MRNPCGTIKTVKRGVTATHVAGEASPTVTITASVTKEAPDEPELKALHAGYRGDHGVRRHAWRLISPLRRLPESHPAAAAWRATMWRWLNAEG